MILPSFRKVVASVSTVFVALFGLFVLAPSHAWAGPIQEFVMPVSGYVSLQFIGGSAAATTTFGLGTDPSHFDPLFSGLPNTPSSTSPVDVGFFSAGTTIHMGMYTVWGNLSGWAFSDWTNEASIVAFSDPTDSLGLGGSIIQQTGPDTWVFNLDDALSYLVDNDNNDVLIQLQITPASSATPEPNSAILLLSGLVLFAWTTRRRRGRATA